MIREQAVLASKVTTGPGPFVYDPRKDTFSGDLRLIGGADVTFDEHKDTESLDNLEILPSSTETNASVSLVVVDISSGKPVMVHELVKRVWIGEPYVPGYLGFREAPAICNLFNTLRQEQPDSVPQILLMDGHGILHPKGTNI